MIACKMLTLCGLLVLAKATDTCPNAPRRDQQLHDNNVPHRKPNGQGCEDHQGCRWGTYYEIADRLAAKRPRTAPTRRICPVASVQYAPSPVDHVADHAQQNQDFPLLAGQTLAEGADDQKMADEQPDSPTASSPSSTASSPRGPQGEEKFSEASQTADAPQASTYRPRKRSPSQKEQRKKDTAEEQNSEAAAKAAAEQDRRERKAAEVAKEQRIQTDIDRLQKEIAAINRKKLSDARGPGASRVGGSRRKGVAKKGQHTLLNREISKLLRLSPEQIARIQVLQAKVQKLQRESTQSGISQTGADHRKPQPESTRAKTSPKPIKQPKRRGTNC